MRTVDRKKRFDVLKKVKSLVLARDAADDDSIPGVDILKLVIELLGSRCTVSDGPAFFRLYGLQQGFDIPPYAFSGSGEIREMLAEVGAHNVKEWYAHVGIRGELFEHIAEYRFVVPVNRSYEHRCYLLAPSWEDVGNWYAQTLAVHLIDFCLASEAPAVPAGIMAGDTLF